MLVASRLKALFKGRKMKVGKAEVEQPIVTRADSPRAPMFNVSSRSTTGKR